MQARSLVAAVAVCAAVASVGAAGPAGRTVTVAIGPPAVIGYLPVYAAQGLGYFRDLEQRTGVRVQFVDFRGGTEAAIALITGDADFATVTLTHVVKAHEQGKDLKFLLTFFNAQAMALVVQPDLPVQTPAQLAGRKIGITSFGSATHMQARHILRYFRVDPDAVQYVAVGGPATAVAAWRRKTIDALVYLDPVITQLVSEGAARLLYDVRTVEGTVRLYGAPYISSGLLTRAEVVRRDPQLVQELVGVFVRTLRWLRAHRTQLDRVAAALPRELGWTPDILRANLSGLSADGRVLPEAVAAVVRSLREDGLVKGDFRAGYDQLVEARFVERAIVGAR